MYIWIALWSRAIQPSGIDVQQTNKRSSAKTKHIPILFNHNDAHYASLIETQQNVDENEDTHKSS